MPAEEANPFGRTPSEAYIRNYVREHGDSIPVREQIDGQWQNVPFSELPADRQALHLARWVLDGHVPSRVK